MFDDEEESKKNRCWGCVKNCCLGYGKCFATSFKSTVKFLCSSCAFYTNPRSNIRECKNNLCLFTICFFGLSVFLLAIGSLAFSIGIIFYHRPATNKTVAFILVFSGALLISSCIVNLLIIFVIDYLFVRLMLRVVRGDRDTSGRESGSDSDGTKKRKKRKPVHYEDVIRKSKKRKDSDDTDTESYETSSSTDDEYSDDEYSDEDSDDEFG